MDELHRVLLDEHGVAGEPDWSRYGIESVSVRAIEAGADGPASCQHS
ncbi:MULTISPECIES: hypothetical protein [Actinomadura]|uniref:Uncharacterized protein n=1 Tax=Actinomadura yumaensis TaxID=111807 RepID=A0ABW2CYQ1_9ACTN|nr:hypothetical protein [Actinomadura sp. J1-007]